MSLVTEWRFEVKPSESDEKVAVVRARCFVVSDSERSEFLCLWSEFITKG